MSFHFKRFQQ